MGGLGYSWYNGLHVYMTIGDLNRTWEGDNNILFQQAGRLLLKNLSNLLTGQPLMPTCEFLSAEMPEPETFKGSIDNLNDLLDLITFKTESLIHEVGIRLQMSQDKAAEWDKCLKHHIYPMVFSYFDRFCIKNYIDFLKNFDHDETTKLVFERMAIIYAQDAIINDAEFYRDILSRDDIIEMKDNLMDQLKELRVDIIPITHTLYFRDKMLGAMGASDMNLYQRFIKCVETSKDEFSRVEEWKYLYE